MFLLISAISLYTFTYLSIILLLLTFLFQNCFLKYDLTSFRTSFFSVSNTSCSSFLIITLSSHIFCEDLSKRLLSICFNSPCIAAHFVSTELFISFRSSFFFSCYTFVCTIFYQALSSLPLSLDQVASVSSLISKSSFLFSS